MNDPSFISVTLGVAFLVAPRFLSASTYDSARTHLHDKGAQMVLENETIRLVLEKKTARVVSLRKEGHELMGNGGQAYHQRIAYDPGDLARHAHDAFTLPKHCVSRTVRQTADLIEVSFVESDPAYFPFRFDSRFVEWHPKSYGDTAWQIGVPDRDSTEFRNGDDFRHWGGYIRERFVSDYPEGVEFLVGSDDWRRDWNYAHMHVNERLDTWRICFTLDELPEGTAHLRFAIAGSRYAGLAVHLAGHLLGQVDLSRGRRYAGQGYPRSGSRGYIHEVVMPFDCARLRAGENLLELTLTPIPGRKDPYRCIHYDCIRLELPDQPKFP